MVDEGFPQKTSRELADEAVRIYLAMLDSLFEQSRGHAYGGDGMSTKDAVQQARRAWSVANRARLFVIPPQLYGAFYRSADVYTCELAGLPWDGVPEGGTADKLVEVWKSGQALPFPDPLPFDACFFAFPFLSLTASQWSMRITDETSERLGLDHVRFLGLLCAVEGETPVAYAALGLRGSNINGEAVTIVGVYNGDWYAPHALDPWVLPAIVRYVNAHKVVVEEQSVGLGTKMIWKKARKKNRALPLPLPKPFYLLHLRDELVDSAMGRRETPAATPPRSPGHRYDVRGHEVVRVARGKLPIDPKLAHKLKQRGYNLYDLGPIGTADADRVFKRRVAPRRPDEWIAVLTHWRDAHVRGPETAPYIPAVRVGNPGTP
jgi:hypothetical protein